MNEIEVWNRQVSFVAVCCLPALPWRRPPCGAAEGRKCQSRPCREHDIGKVYRSA